MSMSKKKQPLRADGPFDYSYIFYYNMSVGQCLSGSHTKMHEDTTEEVT